MAATPANAPYGPCLLHGLETRVWGDQAYRGKRMVIREHAPKARDFTNRRYVTAVLWMRSSGRKIAPSTKVGARVKRAIELSSGCSALPRCAIMGSTRTPQ